MSNYEATLVQIDNIRKHNNADRLQCTNIFGNNIIVGLDTKVGDVGIFFPLESQIGYEFAVANDLIRRKDENGKTVGGMFGNNRRVKAQTLRGEKSMGFYMPLDALQKAFEYVGENIPTNLSIGDDIGVLGSLTISSKFEIEKKNTSTKSKNKVRSSRIVDGQFKFHFDTAQLGRNLYKLNKNDIISITWKMHGTSAIASNILCKKKLSFKDKIAKSLGFNIVDSEYSRIYSSRKVIKNEDGRDYCHFFDYDLWSETGKKFDLHKGETVYYEIVGFTSNGQEIQKKYDYNCTAYTNDVYIYRITHTNVDGVTVELPWSQVVSRSHELGFKAAPTIYYGKASDFIQDIAFDDKENWADYFYEHLASKYVYDQDSQFCRNKVPEEGVVVRVERGDGIESFKLKSFKFLQHETKQLDSGEIDLESEES